MSNKLYETYKSKMRKVADLNYSAYILSWDQEVYLPENSATIRSQQIGTLMALAHEHFTSKELGDILLELKDDASLNNVEKVNIKETLRDYNLAVKLPEAFVIKRTQAESKGFVAWQEAKKKNDFSLFEKELKDLVKIAVEYAELVGFEKNAYDALLDIYEPGSKVESLDILFTDVKNQLVDFVANIRSKPQVDDSFMFKKYDHKKQWDFGIDLLKQMGYDFKTGRQDISSHPFTTSFNSNDVRVTTRIDENNFAEMIWSCIHEGGHALYEQGLQIEQYGLPVGDSISLGIHESQSRLWENNVGRSLPYWKCNYQLAQKYFPENLNAVSVEQFYKGMNKVQSSLIRTNADELTYHFHVLIRYEIEKGLIEGSIAVEELPEIWNRKYKEYLDINVPNNSEGVLQDVHWSHGSFGYFPTYSIGSFYAAQFYNQAKKDNPKLETEIEAGNCLNLLDWLRTNIHQHGKLYSSDEICKKITGETLDFKHFMNYVKNKYAEIYNL